MDKKKMSLNSRARQFLPFDALKGLKEAIKLKELEHERVKKRDISSDKALKISNTLISLDENSIASVLYFKDGHYYEITGKIKLDVFNNYLMADDLKVNLDDLFDIILQE